MISEVLKRNKLPPGGIWSLPYLAADFGDEFAALFFVF